MAVEKEKFIRTHIDGINKFNDKMKNQNSNTGKRKK